jgi:hypothetical protein
MRVYSAMVTVAVLTKVACADASALRFDCILTDTEAKPQSENRPIVVLFDEDNRTLTAEESGHLHSFARVSISNVSINGLADGASLGIDRSSLGIVWQQYDADKVHTEYGHCHWHP